MVLAGAAWSDSTLWGRIVSSDAIRTAATELRAAQQQEVLASLLTRDPALFEKIVVELLVRMKLAVRGEVLGRTGDGGLDGVLYEDRLGLGVIYLQAKRWADSVGRPEIQKFAGALVGKGASRGIFLTTSRFTREAVDYVTDLHPRISLIDGRWLVELMYDYDLCFRRVGVVEIKTVDWSAFDGASGRA